MSLSGTATLAPLVNLCFDVRLDLTGDELADWEGIGFPALTNMEASGAGDIISSPDISREGGPLGEGPEYHLIIQSTGCYKNRDHK